MVTVLSTQIENQTKEILRISGAILHLSEILESEIPARIYLYLRTHGELSLSQLAKSIEKSKTTISRHLNPMLEHNLINERMYKKAYHYKLNPDINPLNTPKGKFIAKNPETKEEFVKLIDNLSPEELELVYKATFSIYSIALKILNNCLGEAMSFVEIHSSAPASVNRILEFETNLNISILFDVITSYNKQIFEKHMKNFLDNYLKDVMVKEESIKGSLSETQDMSPAEILWFMILIPIGQIFKL